MGARGRRGDLDELDDLDGALLVEVEVARLGVLVEADGGGGGEGESWLGGEHGGERGAVGVHRAEEGAVGKRRRGEEAFYESGREGNSQDGRRLWLSSSGWQSLDGPSRSGSCPDPHRPIKILSDLDPTFTFRQRRPPPPHPDSDARSSHPSHRRFGGRALAILLPFPPPTPSFPRPSHLRPQTGLRTLPTARHHMIRPSKAHSTSDLPVTDNTSE